MSSHQISVPSGGEEQFRALRDLLEHGEATVTGANNVRQPIPAPIRDVLVRILTHMEEGQAITIIPASHELTSQEAADLLGVSRQYMVRLLEDGKLPFHRTGTHRRIYFQDLWGTRKSVTANGGKRWTKWLAKKSKPEHMTCSCCRKNERGWRRSRVLLKLGPPDHY